MWEDKKASRPNSQMPDASCSVAPKFVHRKEMKFLFSNRAYCDFSTIYVSFIAA
jgi:hypothetical protein